VYWAHRRGWSFDPTSITPQVLELLKKQFGARYFVTTIWRHLEAKRHNVVQYLQNWHQVSLPGAPRDTMMVHFTQPR
jgi:hypothetical protein